MRDEVRALARFPHRGGLGFASAFCGALSLVALMGPVLLGLLLGLIAFALLLAWQAAQPLIVAVSIGKAWIGPYLVDLERVASWDFTTGSPCIRLQDGTRVSLLTRHTLSPADRARLDEAMTVAMRRVEAADPLDTKALRAVRELAR